MRRVATNDPDVGPFVAERARCTFHADSDHTLGVVDDSQGAARVRGGVIFTGYTGTSLWMHVAGRDEAWLTRDMLFASFHYPFEYLGCATIFGLVEAANGPALAFDLKLGFHVVAQLPAMFASGPGLIVCMPREECRWLRHKSLRKEGLVDGWQGR